MNKATQNDSWVRNPDGSPGWTSSPITGCMKRCDYCFAMTLANGRLKPTYLANDNIAPLMRRQGDRIYRLANETGVCLVENVRQDPFYPRLWMNRIEELDRKLKASKKPLGIFLCIMGELFGDWVPASWQNWVFEIIRRYPQHRFYLLTKQPQNLIKWSPFPPNTYIGVSVTNQSQYDNAVKYLATIEAPVKFLSFEPLLERIDLTV